MFGLKGNNVKLAKKPATATAKRKPNALHPPSILSCPSPYYQDQRQSPGPGSPGSQAPARTRRTQSASNYGNFIASALGGGKPKARPIIRKQSEPIISATKYESIYAQRTTTTTIRQSPRPRLRKSLDSKVISRCPSSEDSSELLLDDVKIPPSWDRVSPLSTASSLSCSDITLPDIPNPTEAKDRQDLTHGQRDKEQNKNDNSAHQNLLNESDHLLQDVVSLCDDIGLESSVINNIRNRRRSYSGTGSQSGSSRAQLPVLTPPLSPSHNKIPIRSNSDSNSSSPQLSITIIHGNGSGNNPGSPKTNYFQGSESGDTISASPQQNDTISRIISTLRLIEQEEGIKQKQGIGDMEKSRVSEYGDFVKSNRLVTDCSSGPPSFRPSSSDNFTCAGDFSPSMIPRLQRINTVTSETARMTPKLPPISSSDTTSIPTGTPPPALSVSSRNFHQQTPSPRNCSLEEYYGNGKETDQHDLSPRQRGNLAELNSSPRMGQPPQSTFRPMTTTEKTNNIFSFLDEVEKSDRDILFNLKFDSSQTRGVGGPPSGRSNVNIYPGTVTTDFPVSIMDTLIRKGSVELAREVILLERKIEEITQNVTILEDSLMSQRELNVRNIKNSQRDLKKRLRIQQEEFELALARHQTFVDQLIAEKRVLQDKCEKVLKESKESDQRLHQQIKSLQEKHLDELKQLRKLQENAEKSRKQKWVGNKTQEIRHMTVKGLEPEVQRIIQRHQQEMTEVRAWHADELREMEERNARKQTMHFQELRDSFNREKDEACCRERAMAQKRFDADFARITEEFESHKKRLVNELEAERERFAMEEAKWRDLIQENVRKAQIKGEVELDSQKQELENKIANLERRHESELKSLKDVYENQQENLLSQQSKKFELMMSEKEIALQESFHAEKEQELKEKEKKLKEEFKKLREEEEMVQTARIKRLHEKFQSELSEFEKSEQELKQKFSQAKSEALAKEEQIFSLQTTLNLKEKQISELSEANMKMTEERLNLTSVIRREFNGQIETLEEESRSVKSAVLELKAKQKLELEAHAMEVEKVRGEKDIEMEKIGVRVKHALHRKEEAIQELQKQLEKSQIRVSHLEHLLEQQRKDFVTSISETTIAPHHKKK